MFAHDAFQLVHAAVNGGARSREALAQALPATQSSLLAGPSDRFGADRNPARATRVLELKASAFIDATP